VTTVEHILGEGWIIEPAGGSTGAAYYAQSNKKRLFLKRNSSPFLAVLSAQGIVPKLVWTKRLENGDVVTAQQWLEGKALNVEEMQHPKVATLLSKIHHSSELLDMLLRIEKTTVTPVNSLQMVKEIIEQNSQLNHSLLIRKIYKYLQKRVKVMPVNHTVVCHCDLNHHNWMLSEEGELYLIDWDNARVGDPAMDIGRILQSYIPVEDWEQWLNQYGLEYSYELMQRMHWYLLIDEIIGYAWAVQQKKDKEANYHYEELNQLLYQVNNWNL
jgi:thiamine kinase-like enzyme